MMMMMVIIIIIIIIVKWKGINRTEHISNSLVCFEVYEIIIEKKISI